MMLLDTYKSHSVLAIFKFIGYNIFRKLSKEIQNDTYDTKKG